jgi:hypothetical protein
MNSKANLVLAVVLAAAGVALLAGRLSRKPSAVPADALTAAYAASRGGADRSYLRRRIKVSGGWSTSSPSPDGRGMTLELRGRAGLLVHCRFEGVPLAERDTFEGRFAGREVVTVAGVCAGRDGDRVVLCECELVD